MGYVEQTLSSDEVVVLKARFHFFQHLASWLALIVLGIVIVGIIIFLRREIRFATTEIAATNHRIVLKTGWLTRRTEELPVQAVEEVSLFQGFFGKLFGFGWLRITGTGEGCIDLPTIAAPMKFRAAIEEARSWKRKHA